MAIFKYTGQTNDGRKVSGNIEAGNTTDASLLLEEKGISPTSVECVADHSSNGVPATPDASSSETPKTPDLCLQNLKSACQSFVKASELRDGGDKEAAETSLRVAESLALGVIRSPSLATPIEADARCILGWIQKLGGRHQDAQASLEKGHALGIAKGFAMGMESFHADYLADLYDLDAQSLFSSGKPDEAIAILTKLEDFVSRYKSSENFNSVRHEGYLLFGRGKTATLQGNLNEAVDSFKRILSPPYKDWFESNKHHNFVLQGAYESIGRILFHGFYRVDEAIPYLQEALRYCEKGDENYQSNLAFLEEAKSQPTLPSDLKAKLEIVRTGNAESQVKAMMELAKGVQPQYFRAVESAIVQAMRGGDNRVQFRCAQTLARIGDDSDRTVKMLLIQLDPPQSENESMIKSEALFGLSYIKNRGDVIPEMIKLAEHDKDTEVRERAIFALAATGSQTGKEYVDRLAADGNDSALFALDWLEKDVEWLHTAVLCGRRKLPGGALSVYARGWNELRWGASLDEFQRRFPEAYFDSPCWVTGEGEERFEHIRISQARYMFNAKGQLYLIGFNAPEGVDLLSGDYAQHLLRTFGDPDGTIGTSWSYNSLVLKVTQSGLVLINTDFSDDPNEFERWTGKKKEQAPVSLAAGSGSAATQNAEPPVVQPPPIPNARTVPPPESVVTKSSWTAKKMLLIGIPAAIFLVFVIASLQSGGNRSTSQTKSASQPQTSHATSPNKPVAARPDPSPSPGVYLTGRSGPSVPAPMVTRSLSTVRNETRPLTSFSAQQGTSANLTLGENIKRFSQYLEQNNMLSGAFRDYQLVMPPAVIKNASKATIPQNLYDIAFVGPNSFYNFHSFDGGVTWMPLPARDQVLLTLSRDFRKGKRSTDWQKEVDQILASTAPKRGSTQSPARKEAMHFVYLSESDCRSRDFDTAIANCTQAIGIDPTLARAYSQRGRAYCEKQDYEKSIADCSKAIELDPADYEGYYNRAFAYRAKADYDKAIADFSKAIEMKPTNPWPYLYRGLTYGDMGNYDKAWEDVNHCKQVHGRVDDKLLEKLRVASGRNE